MIFCMEKSIFLFFVLGLLYVYEVIQILMCIYDHLHSLEFLSNFLNISLIIRPLTIERLALAQTTSPTSKPWGQSVSLN